MARLKKQIPKQVLGAEIRLAGLKSIDPALDLGSGITVEAMETAFATVLGNLENYNTMLSKVDEHANIVEANVKVLADLSVRALAAVKSKYGPDSNEYEKAGGVRRSERRRPVRRPRQPTP